MKFLLADDHQMVRLALRVALAPLDAGLVFVEAENAERAIAEADAHEDLDLVLIDIHMPGMGGVEGVRRLRAAHPALPLIAPRQADVLRLLALGKPNKVIARELDISEATVKVHLLAVFRALGARNRTEAVVIAQRSLPGKNGAP